MKSTVAIGIVALCAFAASPAWANAKSSTVRHDEAVTGCLDGSGSAGQYKLIDQEGTTWILKEGKYIDLAPYLGHNVTVAGPEIKRHGDHLTVLDVAVDSPGCHQ